MDKTKLTAERRVKRKLYINAGLGKNPSYEQINQFWKSFKYECLLIALNNLRKDNKFIPKSILMAEAQMVYTQKMDDYIKEELELMEKEEQCKLYNNVNNLIKDLKQMENDSEINSLTVFINKNKSKQKILKLKKKN